MTRNLLILLTIISCCSCKQQQAPGWKMVWNDEFDKKGAPDTTRWKFDLGSNDGWGNNELEYYTANNATIDSGFLTIEARKEPKDTFRYTSARMLSKQSWQYGKIEVRAKLPQGVGSWPAIWMLADGMKEWPDDGEIDIMEHVGFHPGYIHASIHCKKYNHVIHTQKTDTILVNDFATTFHVYAVEWDKDSIGVSVDGNKYFSFANEHTGYDAWPFDNKMQLILNVAVGGNWGGQQGVDDNAFPLRMQLDYVRVYQKEKQ